MNRDTINWIRIKRKQEVAMEKLKKHIHDDSNGLDYVLVGDYYIPDLQLPEESRPIGRWGRMHREYLQEYCPDRYNELLLSGKLWTYLADLDEQAQNRLDCIIKRNRGSHGGIESKRPACMGRSHEQHTPPGRGSHSV
jgi:hypothetical protein